MTTTKWYGDAVLQKVEAAVLIGVERGIADVETRAVELIMEPPKTGRIYRRRGVEHQASAPGQAPASDTGNLARNRTKDVDPAALRGVLTFRSKYARPLETGSQRIAPRPYARRALNEKRKDIEADIQAEVAAALR